MSAVQLSQPRIKIGWPKLNLEEWKDTYETLHMWTQIIGKIRLAQTPWTNHSWHVTLYVTSQGLTTSPIPYNDRSFQIDFDFIEHQVIIRTNDGDSRNILLHTRTVSEFYEEVFSTLKDLDIEIEISKKPNEVLHPIYFDQDTEHYSYNPEYANRFWRILVQTDRIFKKFRTQFIGKCSPAHFFWGAFDFAITRFSGRPAPEHPGGIPNLPDFVVRDAYSHEVSSCGFWPGGGPVPYAAFYSYCYPEPNGFSSSKVYPRSAFYSNELKEFILPYNAVRESRDPEKTLLDFLNSTYKSAATLGNWDRDKLEHTY